MQVKSIQSLRELEQAIETELNVHRDSLLTKMFEMILFFFSFLSS